MSHPPVPNHSLKLVQSQGIFSAIPGHGDPPHAYPLQEGRAQYKLFRESWEVCSECWELCLYDGQGLLGRQLPRIE